MKILKTKINFTDERGEIRDILSHTPVDAITFISSATGCVRGNHYHKESIQYAYILRGRMEAYAQIGEDASTRSMEVVEAGDLILHEMGEAHAFKALEPSEFLSITQGPRNGEDYEKDTFRLVSKMIE